MNQRQPVDNLRGTVKDHNNNDNHGCGDLYAVDCMATTAEAKRGVFRYGDFLLRMLGISWSEYWPVGKFSLSTVNWNEKCIFVMSNPQVVQKFMEINQTIQEWCAIYITIG